MQNFKLTMTLSLLLFFIGSLMTSTNAQCTHQTLIDNLMQALNQKDTSQLSAIYATNAKIHQPAKDVDGFVSIQDGYQNYFNRMPGATQTIEEAICTNDRLVVRWSLTGTPQGVTQQITLSGINICHIANGKITEEWASTDFFAIVKQLGYTLQPPSGGE